MKTKLHFSTVKQNRIDFYYVISGLANLNEKKVELPNKKSYWTLYTMP